MIERRRRPVFHLSTLRAMPVRDAVRPCSACGVLFVGPPERRAHVEHILRVHERICPGGSRSGDVATPFE